MRSWVLLVFIMFQFSHISDAQTRRFRTLNHFVINDTINCKMEFDSFEFISATVTINDTNLVIKNNWTDEKVIYDIKSIEIEEGFKIAHLSNGEQFYYNDKLKFVYFVNNHKRIRQYRRL